MTEKYKKTCFNPEKNDFDKQTACGAPIGWSKYTTSKKSETGVHIYNDINYKRMSHLEGANSHVVIIDLFVETEIKRKINIYRSFNRQGGIIVFIWSQH